MQIKFAERCIFCCLVCLLSVFLILPSAFAQETTGGIKGYVKDKSGATVVAAEVTLSGTALISPRKVDSDSAGYFYFQLVPPGEYTLTVTAKGFRVYKQTGIDISAAKLPTYEIMLDVGSVTETVEVSGQTPIVDTTTSKVSTTIEQDLIDTLPKGRSYQSLIALAPGARQEPLQSSRNDRLRQNGFQIDGASDSENTYLVEGMDTSNVENGGIKQNVIFEFVQEVQVKTSGNEAEYGGALGGVVNVLQKRGSNQWHGSLLVQYRSDKLDASDQCATTPQPVVSNSVLPSGQQLACGLRYDPGTSVNGDPTEGPIVDQAANYYQQKKDQYTTVEPGYTVGGPIFKDKLWMFSSYVPTIDRYSRTVNFTGATNPGVRTFTRNFTQHNMLNRLDYQPFSKVHLYGGWQYGYSRIRGQLPTLPDSVAGQANPIGGSDPTQFRPDAGSVNPSNIFNFGGDWTPNSRTVVAVRYGYFYYNSEDRGLPAGIRYVYSTDLTAGVTKSPLTSQPIIPAGDTADAPFAQSTGTANIANNLTTQHDIYSRKSLATDVSYSVSKWGQHNFKGGYTFNKLANNVFQNINTAGINLAFGGTSYTPSTPAGVAACTNVIIPYNQANYGSSVCNGFAGYFTIRDGVVTNGNASSYNHGLYVQDSWTVGHGLTLNLGVRFEKEYLPPYSAGNPSISFGWTDKVAPRIGGAYDLLHNGKLKIFASYGKFYDIMKYSLPRGSFGGDYWHDCVYAMDFVDFNTITPTSPGGHACGPTFDPAAGVTVGRFIENINWRAPAGNPADPGVDPNLKPFSQHEFLVGTDWAITPRMGLEIRYARKRVDNMIDDQSIDDSIYYIGNPGPNTYSDLLHRALPAMADLTGNDAFLDPNGLCPQCPHAPRAERRYDGIETRLRYRGTRLNGQIAYTYSRLYGNFSGLTDTDVTDASGGRHNANNNRTFDLPEMQFTTSGKVADGPLGTDRPNVLNMAGSYTFKWFGMETSFGLIQTIAQGSPKSTCLGVVDSASACQFYDQRGTWATFSQDTTTGAFSVDKVDHSARMPFLTQTDVNLGHSFRVSKANEALRLAFEVSAINLLNQHAVLSVNPNPLAQGNQYLKLSDSSPLGTDVNKFLTGYDVAAESTAQGGLIQNSRYGLPFLFQNARTMRLGVRFIF